ncbi:MULTISPECIES: phage shock envelope stress response protein PspM [Rhodococcus]|uniref:Uncharacterized protein n=1 Tax=Rhodococcus qingshengii JCM 15477 TaxID=1303681 RepID=A0AB38RKB3_RHOSG|nr:MULTISPECIES: hypothetical protein [Rhodococcus]UPU45530.1 hypothetical protein M0639_12900 [Rhodococcus qingshengii JCM 15477]
MFSSRDGRSGREPRSAVPVSVSGAFGALGRTADTLREVGLSAADAARRWQDPRAKFERKRARARRRAQRWGFMSGGSVVGTAGLAVASAPEWSVVVAGGGAALFAVPAVIAVGRYRSMSSGPPPSAPIRRRLPPSSSRAFIPMSRLIGAETSLFEILSVLRRADTIDPNELDEITVTADSALRAMFAVSLDVVAMERAVAATPKVTEPLDPTIDGAVRELQSGLDQYEDLVTSAAALTAPHSPSALVGFNRELSALHAAAERLSALADAIGEVDDITRKYN